MVTELMERGNGAVPVPEAQSPAAQAPPAVEPGVCPYCGAPNADRLTCRRCGQWDHDKGLRISRRIRADFERRMDEADADAERSLRHQREVEGAPPAVTR